MATSSKSWPGEAAFRQSIEFLPNAIWTLNGAGVLDWCNEPFCELIGRTRSDILELGFPPLLHPIDRTGAAAAKPVGEPMPLEARLGRDDMWRWQLLKWRQAAPDAGVDIWVGSATDVDKQVSAVANLIRDNEELEQDVFRKLHESNSSRTRLQTIFNACPDYLYLVRLSANGLSFESLNPAAEILFVGGRDAVLGRPADDVEMFEPLPSMERHVRETLAKGSISYEVTGEISGHQRAIVQIVGAPLAYSNETEGFVLFCGRDVTEQRGIEDALRQSQKMEAVGQLTGGLAHDFNNLLTGIAGSLDLLKLRISQKRFDAVDRYLSAAQDAADRAASLTHRLLAFSRRQTLDPKRIDANKLVFGMQELLQRTVGPEIEIVVVLQPELWTVLVDPSQLENALLNLCINARDAMPKGGLITIETKNIDQADPQISRQHLPDGDLVSISVTDNGNGIPPDVLGRIFDPFFTTKPLGSGTGLGLSMIYGFAQQSGGQILVDSVVGRGTRMQMLLPRQEGPAELMRDVHRGMATPRSVASETVLIVDDVATVRMLVTEFLQDLGYQILQAKDAIAGLSLLQSTAHIDLLVTDVGMPGGMNGRQLAEAGRVLRPDLRVLFITGYAESTALNKDHLGSGIEVLTKPFTMEVLASRIANLLREATI